MPSRRLNYRGIDIPQMRKNEWDTENARSIETEVKIGKMISTDTFGNQ
jgi:hypothetical protein